MSDSILSQEVSKLVRGEPSTVVTHYFFWKAIGREKGIQNTVVVKISGHLEWASTARKKYFPQYSA